ncbi:hypothetical protein CI238_00712 [Colletotrichum incanum]|uniref:Uncharacterized protein n=1 Tax=Colletotrichum incanum TaxID=1573173 RepID=A0A166RRB3_COLIC|nr:hypothetical protein CI238_00712 [Colletotrichum incanum]
MLTSAEALRGRCSVKRPYTHNLLRPPVIMTTMLRTKTVRNKQASTLKNHLRRPLLQDIRQETGHTYYQTIRITT